MSATSGVAARVTLAGSATTAHTSVMTPRRAAETAAVTKWASVSAIRVSMATTARRSVTHVVHASAASASVTTARWATTARPSVTTMERKYGV